MQRLRQFANNAGTFGILQTLAIVVIVFFATRRDVADGNGIITVPLLAATFATGFVLRHFLVANIHWMKWVMNAVATAGIIFVLIYNQSGPEPLWLRALFVSFIGLYMGCHFWMLSDPRVARAD